MRLILALVLLVALSACSSDKDTPKVEPRKTQSSAPAAPVPEDASGSGACAEVRAGIDAFNAGDFARTIKHFELALPLAEAQSKKNPSKAADDLLAAIKYYAELAPEDYPGSARTSPDFMKYKAITLGQCVSGSAPLQDEPSQSPGVTT